MFSFLSRLFSGTRDAPAANVPSPLDYDQMVVLDAEDLAEQGIGEAYASLLPMLRRYVPDPQELVEDIDADTGRYAIRCGTVSALVYGPEEPGSDADSWGRATVALFDAVNAQLADAAVRFHAINGGNDLGGMFITPEQVREAQASLPRKSDWPYLPEAVPPHFGQGHP